MSRIFLVGMPGVGKTYWGRKLATKYDYTFADLDEEIHDAEGRTISEIFATDGESYFRCVETECLYRLCLKDKTIIACGGGTPVYNDNLLWMKRHGCVVYLITDINTLSERVGQDAARPLLGSGDVRQHLKTLYTERAPYYQQADYTVQADETIIANFGKIIELCTGRH